MLPNLTSYLIKFPLGKLESTEPMIPLGHIEIATFSLKLPGRLPFALLDLDSPQQWLQQYCWPTSWSLSTPPNRKKKKSWRHQWSCNRFLVAYYYMNDFLLELVTSSLQNSRTWTLHCQMFQIQIQPNLRKKQRTYQQTFNDACQKIY